MRRSSRSEPSLARALSPAADAKSTETPSALRQIEAPSTALGYIAYSFDINSGGLAPQEPMPLGGGARIELRTMGKHSQQAESEVARMAAVPKALNEFLKSKAGAERRDELDELARARRVRMEIVKGLFEPLGFVLDEGDSTLWLANASKLRCRFLPKTAQDGVHDETLKSEVLFFEEEDFEEEMRETESVIEYLKKRFGGDPGVASGGNGVRGIEVSASDQLAGVGVPSNLVNFYEEEEKMLRYYEDEVRIMALRRERLPQHESKAVGLGCWFRRWVKAVKGVRPPQGGDVPSYDLRGMVVTGTISVSTVTDTMERPWSPPVSSGAETKTTPDLQDVLPKHLARAQEAFQRVSQQISSLRSSRASRVCVSGSSKAEENGAQGAKNFQLAEAKEELRQGLKVLRDTRPKHLALREEVMAELAGCLKTGEEGGWWYENKDSKGHWAEVQIPKCGNGCFS
ncbi:Alpha/beta hydrolase domain-containing protein 17C [Durusdinium trenchii]|uniref:Alpha/beta hydrolase domain-containing protein 17C n=1 Tax=Durusdinium trenchii TaxID=1381693 RepID=A0ABP0JHE2_9DINO